MEHRRTLTGTIKDLQARKVFQTALAYVFVAWLIVQAGDIVLPAFEAPEWVMRALITVLVVCFPLVVVLAWLFDFTHKGIKRTEATTTDRLFTHSSARWTLGISSTVLTIGAVWWVWAGYFAGPEYRVTVPEDSDEIPFVAVAPLANLSGNEQLDWLSEGVANLVRNALTQSRYLIVVSRLRWNTITRNLDPDRLAEAAEAAGVDYIVSGEFLSSPEGLVLVSRVTDVKAGVDLQPQRLNNLTPEMLLASADSISMLAKQAIHVPHTESVDVFTADFAVDNVAAYEAYIGALESLMQYQYRQAEAGMKLAIELAPDFWLAHYRLAELQAIMSRRDEAVVTLEGIPEDARLTPRERYYVDGARALSVDDYERAMTVYQAMLEEYPYEIEARLLLAEGYYFQYEEQKALEVLNLLAKQEPENQIVWGTIGDLSTKIGNFAEAENALNRCLSLVPEEPSCLAYLAELQTLQGEYDQAIILYEKALNTGKEFSLVPLGLARAYTVSGRATEAEALLNKTIADTDAAPVNRIDAAFELAHLLRAQGRFAESLIPLESVQESIEQEQVRESMALATRAMSKMELGDYAAATELIEVAIERSIGVPTRYLFARGLLELRTDALAAAKATATEIRGYALAPEDPDRTEERAAAYLEGMAQLQAGETQTAIESLKKAETLEGYRYALYRLGLSAAVQAAGDNEHAAALAAEAARARDPGDMRMDLELDRNRALLQEAKIRLAMGELDQANRLAQAYLDKWRGSETHPDLTSARQLAEASEP